MPQVHELGVLGVLIEDPDIHRLGRTAWTSPPTPRDAGPVGGDQVADE